MERFIASDPSVILIQPGLYLCRLEYLLPTADRVDIVLIERFGRFVAVEVEVDCGADEVIGPLQCMKYRALLAYAFEQRVEDVRCILALRSIHARVRERCRRFGIEVVELARRLQSDHV